MYSIISIELYAEMSHFVPQLHGITHMHNMYSIHVNVHNIKNL